MGARITYYNINTPASYTITSNSIDSHCTLDNTLVTGNTICQPNMYLDNQAQAGGDLITNTSPKGYVSQVISGADGKFQTRPYIQITSTTDVTSTGVSFWFPKDNYPVDFAIQVGDEYFGPEDVNTQEQGNSIVIWVGNELTYRTVKFTFMEMKIPNTKVKMHHFAFGRVIEWYGSDIISCEVNESISLEELPINTSKAEVVTYGYVRGFQKGQVYDIYHVSYDENGTRTEQFIRRDQLYKVSYNGNIMTFEGRDCIDRYTHSDIPADTVKKRFNEDTTATVANLLDSKLGIQYFLWHDTAYNYSTAQTNGGFKEQISKRTALMHVAYGTGNFINTSTGVDFLADGTDVRGKARVAPLGELVYQNETTSTQKVPETSIFEGGSFTEDTEYKYLDMGLNWFRLEGGEIASSGTGHITSTNTDTASDSTRELDFDVYMADTASYRQGVVDNIGLWIFKSKSYSCTYVMPAYTKLGEMIMLELEVGTYTKIIPYERTLHLEGNKILAEVAGKCI